MTKLAILMCLVACGGGGDDSNHTGDAPDAGTGSGTGSGSGSGSGSAITGYSMTTIAGSCDPLSSPQVLPLGGFTHVTDVYDLPSPVPFWTETAGRMAVAEQGQLFLFPASGSTDLTTLVDPIAIPSTMAPNGFVAPFWMFHLSYVAMRSEIDAATVAGHVTIQWNDFAIGGITADQASHVTIQVKLFATGAIELHYCQLDPGGQPAALASGDHAVIGVESPDGAKGVQAGAFTAGTATTASAYRFTPM